MDCILSIENLTKRYGAVVGADNVSFSIDQGEIYGFLGPNGAGKTTCIRLILGLLRPDSGRIRVFGADTAVDRWRFKARVGNLPGEVSWWPTLTGRELLDFFGRFRHAAQPEGASPGRTARPVLQEDLLDAFKLDNALLDRKVRTFSRGTRRKLGLVIAMQHDPDLLILDEPTSGLDPLVRHAFFEVCRGLRERGKTLFLSSHNLAETREICDRVAIIRKGRLIAVESLEKLKEKSVRRVEAVFDGRPEKDWFAIPGVAVLDIGADRAVLACQGSPAPLMRVLAQKGLKDLVVMPPALDDLFLRLYENADFASDNADFASGKVRGSSALTGGTADDVDHGEAAGG
jgi:ABC-2 type transport system ATP-binding protein